MAIQYEGLRITRVANSSLIDKLHHICKPVAAGKCDLAGVGDRYIGVVWEEAEAGRAATLQVSGVVKVKLGGTVTAGDGVRANSSGQGVSSTESPADHELGVALESGVSGDVIPVLISLK